MPQKIDDLFEFAVLINERAKKILVMDKLHKSMFVLCCPSGKWGVVEMNAENQTEKFILVRSIADQVRRTNASGVIAVSEVWTIFADEQENHELAAESSKRREALEVLAVDKDQIRGLITSFTRGDDGSVQLAGTHELVSSSANIMQPIVDALRERK